MNSVKSFMTMINQLNYILDRKQKRGAIKVFLSMVLSTAMELLGVSAIYPFLQLMINAEELQKKWYVNWITNMVPDISVRALLVVVGIMIIVIYIFKNLFMLLNVYIQNNYAARLQKETSVKVLEAYMNRTYQYFLNTNSSIIMRGISSDVTGVYQMLLNCFTLFAEIMNVIVLGIFLLITDLFISLSAMLLAFICFLAIVLGFKSKMKRAGQAMREATNLKYQYSYQAINGIKEITVLDRRANFINRYRQAAEVEEKSAITNGFIMACPDRILEGVCIAGFMGIVCIEILIGVDLNNFLPVLGTFAMGAFRILPSISKISSRLNAMVFYRPCLQNTYDILKEINRDGNKDFAIDDTDLKSSEECAAVFCNELKVADVSWKYLNSKESVLNGLCLTIHRGESVAFIGSSGAGKTTLADVLMGLLKPQSGTVTMDGIDIFSIPHRWARIIGYVPQSVYLIDDTVRSNVAFGIDKTMISDEKVWVALEQAQLKGFVEKLPNGLDAIVGERGVKFSGGQRQRIAIARALYENPDILVLDEATSALDNETEAAVMESIDALQGVKTLIIVAHRLTTIRNCDTIYEIKEGVAIRRSKEELGLTKDR